MIHFLFDGPPGPEGARFVECETPDGKSVNAGEWHERPDGLWELRVAVPRWRPISTAPKDDTVLVAVVPTNLNTTFYGKRGATTFPAYINSDGEICDPGTWKADTGLDGSHWTTTHWAPLLAPPSTGVHWSDCAVHNEPAMPNGPCDCGANAPVSEA